MSPEREQAEALIILAAIPKCDAAHGRLGYFWSDCESCVVYRDAAAAVSRLVERAEKAERERQSRTAEYVRKLYPHADEGVSELCAFAAASCEQSERRAADAEAQVAALVGRERELTRALEAADRFFRGDLNHVRAFMPRTLVAEALAGGGRTPTGLGKDFDLDSGGLGLSAEPVAEAARMGLSRLALARASMRQAIKNQDFSHLEAWLEAADHNDWLGEISAALTTATVSPPEPVSPGAADVAEAGPTRLYRPEVLPETREGLAERLRVAVTRASAAEHDRDAYRIEADCAMSDYDDLELRYGQAVETLQAIADRRPNERFDPWACNLARETLAKVERTDALTTETSPRTSLQVPDVGLAVLPEETP